MSSRPRSRATVRRLTVSLADAAGAISATVALLVLRPGPAPARVVAADPGPARGEARSWPARGTTGPAAHDRLIAQGFAHRPRGRPGRTAPKDGRATGRTGRGRRTGRDEVGGRRRWHAGGSARTVRARAVRTVAATEGSRS